MKGDNVSEEKVSVSGGQLVDKMKELIHEGNVRRVRIIHDGRTLVDVPLTLGVPVAAATVVWAPVLAAVGAIAGLVTDCTLEIERVDEKAKDDSDGPAVQQSAGDVTRD
jgi:hypothetical protein